MRADLATLQSNFAQALLDIDALPAVLPDFKGDTQGNRERFAFYRGNIRAIWLQSCTAAYPVLLKLLGADFFDDLARAFGRHYPSQSGNLTEFAADLPRFIATLENCRAYPYLSDVATLEWHVHRAYFLKFDEPVTLFDLASIPADRLADLRCTLQPSCALFRSRWDVAEIWHSHQAVNPAMPESVGRESTCLVWRESWQSSWKVHVTAISPGAYTALTALSGGATLGSALENAQACDPKFVFQSELADWLQKQLITSITL